MGRKLSFKHFNDHKLTLKTEFENNSDLMAEDLCLQMGR